MGAKRLIRAPLRTTTLVAALVAAMVVAFTMFVQGGGAARAADERPSAPVSPKIVGGTEVPDGKYPFMAFLDIRFRDGSASSCGGTLIDPDSVLTAAHCLFGLPSDQSKWKLQVIVGRTVRASTQGQVLDWKTLAIHPAYNPKSNANDAAVINLSRAVSGSTPITLATATQNNLESPGSTATVAGWGNTIAGPPGAEPPGGPEIPNRMHEAQVPIVSDSSAQQAFVGQDLRYLPPVMIAAGGNVADACQGDSGGPLFAWVSGKYTQIGIVSAGIGCASDTPGVYAEVNNPSIGSFITKEASR